MTRATAASFFSERRRPGEYDSRVQAGAQKGPVVLDPERNTSEEHLVRVMRCAAHPIEAKQNVYVPKNAEAKRRIDWFNSTLRLPMPRAMPVAKMRSLSTLTP